MKKKILFVFGTRPEAIKLFPLIKEFEKQKKKFDIKICITSQHKQMLNQALELLDIRPDFNLNIMKKNQDLFYITAKVLEKLKSILLIEKPDLLIVQGDTTTAFAAALAAFYCNIKIAHIEAGLRTYNLKAPYPEEANRRFISIISEYNFAPTVAAASNLKKENVNLQKIFITGNTVVDALILIRKLLYTNKQILTANIASLSASINFNKKIILVTGHRRESFGSGFENICLALKALANQYPDFEIVYPVHLNPNVRKPVYEILNGIDNIKLLKPVNYFQFVYLLDKAYLVLTDSGGVQEEAPSFGKPVVVLREITERPEGVKAGIAVLAGNSKEKIILETRKIIDNKKLYKKMSCTVNPYGDGNASKRIVNIINRNGEKRIL